MLKRSLEYLVWRPRESKPGEETPQAPLSLMNYTHGGVSCGLISPCIFTYML